MYIYFQGLSEGLSEYMQILKPGQNDIQLGDQLCVGGRLGPQGARTSIGKVKIKFIYMKQELQCLSEYIWIIKPWQNNIQLGDQGWGLLSQFSPFRYFPIFPNDQNSGYLYDIKFKFGRCHRSSHMANMNMIESI